jgi:hypothetical protein
MEHEGYATTNRSVWFSRGTEEEKNHSCNPTRLARVWNRAERGIPTEAGERCWQSDEMVMD